MNEKRKAQLIFLSILSVFNSNLRADNSSLQDRNVKVENIFEKQIINGKKVNTSPEDLRSNVKNISEKQIIDNKKVNTKYLPKIRPKILPNKVNESKEVDSEMGYKTTLVTNAITVLLACAIMYSFVTFIPWGWNKAMNFLEEHSLFRSDEYNYTSKIKNRLINSKYKKYGVESVNEDDDTAAPEKRINFVNLGNKKADKNGNYEVQLDNSKYHCIIISKKAQTDDGIKINIKKGDSNVENSSIIVIVPTHVELSIDKDTKINLLRVSAPSVFLKSDNDGAGAKVISSWWQNKNNVKEIFLDTPGSIYYSDNKNETATQIDDLKKWKAKDGNVGSNTTIEKLTFGPIHITNT